MKPKITTLAMWLMLLLILCLLSSCKKDDVAVSVGIGPVSLTWGGTNTNGYYYGGLPPYGSNYFVGYIAARPRDQNNIPICTSAGVPFCTASCSYLYWTEASYFMYVAQNATYPPLRPVLVRVQWNTMTTAPNDFYIVGY